MNNNTRRIVAIMAGAVLLAGGCTARKPVQSTPQVQHIGAPVQQTQTAPTPQVIEVTRIVEVAQPTQPAQVVEVTRVVEVVITPTPDIQGFSAPAQIGADESTQPCPLKYWRNGRCTATQAQIEQAASEVQP